MTKADRSLLLIVAAALVDAHDRVLVQQRPAGKAMAGLWEFPGGKLERGETPEAALVRELAEELGILVSVDDVTPVAFASVSLGTGHLVLMLYRCRRWAGEPHALHATALRWCLPRQLRLLTMPPADRPLIDALENMLRPNR